MRRSVIGVMGGGTVDEETLKSAAELGRLIAEHGWVLLNGGRDAGVMAASARGAKQAGGLVVGILPGSNTAGCSPDLDLAVVTGMGDGRNVINVLSCDVVVACRGGAGTVSEVALALKSGKPVVLMGLEVGSPLDEYRAAGLMFEAAGPAEAVEHVAGLLGAAGKIPPRNTRRGLRPQPKKET